MNQFKPEVIYNPDGQLIKYLGKDGPYYADYIDPNLTVYRDELTDLVMGISLAVDPEKLKQEL